jgi:hypothetical protein
MTGPALPDRPVEVSKDEVSVVRRAPRSRESGQQPGADAWFSGSGETRHGERNEIEPGVARLSKVEIHNGGKPTVDL